MTSPPRSPDPKMRVSIQSQPSETGPVPSTQANDHHGGRSAEDPGCTTTAPFTPGVRVRGTPADELPTLYGELHRPDIFVSHATPRLVPRNIKLDYQLGVRPLRRRPADVAGDHFAG